ncbi:MAG: thermonuclease family protein [Bacillota bacterium]
MKNIRELAARKWFLAILSLLCLSLLAGCGDVDEASDQYNTDTRTISEIDSPLLLEKAEVVRVVDGDTVVVRLETGAEERVRFIGVNTPESTTKHEPYGEEAASFTRSRLDGEIVYLEKDVSDRDRYGRLLRYIWLEPPAEVSEDSIRGKLFNAILLLEGYAQVATYAPDVKYTDDYFIRFQTEARELNKGLWGLKSDAEESAHRNALDARDQQTSTVYVTNSGKKYHRDGCRYLKQNKVPMSLEEAQSQGYEPCSVCKSLLT